MNYPRTPPRVTSRMKAHGLSTAWELPARSVGGLTWLWLWLGLVVGGVQGQQRFPPPDFESGHRLPITTTPPARASWLPYLDLAVLLACLIAASWLVYRKRSRRGIVALSLFSLAYFGFWRKGCICSIGSVQNIALALFDPAYAVPATVLAFFLAPLVLALFFGRSFCAAVCPHGALQDLVLLKPIPLPEWLEQGLGILPFIYLGAGVLLAGTGSAFLICQYDPFVPIFRLNGRTAMVLCGAALLVLGVFVGRPYCRFLCPYGALLRVCAGLARWPVRVTPNSCTQCRLCETSCPFGALRRPQAIQTEPRTLTRDRRRLAILLGFLPILIGGGACLGGMLSDALSMVHPTVALSERYLHEPNAAPKTGALSPDDLSLDRARQDPDALLREARSVRHKVRTASWLFGAWAGAVVGFKLISLGIYRNRADYEPASGECFACARCFEFCPNELARRGVQVGAAPASTPVPVLTQAEPSEPEPIGPGQPSRIKVLD